MAMDILWSDPTPNDESMGIQPNTVRDPQKQNNIMMYGPDQVEKFMKNNGLSMIIRGHQVCSEGLDRFAAGQLITLNSCTNYGGTQNNDAAFLVIQKKLVISPKIIQPFPQATPWLTIGEIPESANSSVRRP